jgi:NTP pyrophosphatase (non-canonical NTP hydrolase)
MEFKEIEELVLNWASRRRMFSFNQGTTALRQCDKLWEEFKELRDAIEKNEIDKIKDGLGDMLVVMTIIAELKFMSLTACYETAYNEIKDRKGKMVDGIFVKES